MTAKQNNSLNLTKLQQSILHEYKRLSYGPQTKLHNFLEIRYSQLPISIPHNLIYNVTNCIILQSSSCFEVITFAVMEYIFTCFPQEKKRIIDKIRSSICDPNFLFGSSTIKGLLIKGLKRMSSYANDMKKPIANYLTQDESLTAFSQFWKEVIQEQSKGEVQTFSDEPQVDYFHHISNYLGVEFDLIWQTETNYEETIISPGQSSDRLGGCKIIISKAKQASQSSVEYLILLSKKRRSLIQQLWEIQPEPIPSGLSQQFNILKARAWEVKQKGYQLAKQFRQFYNLIKDV